MNTISKRYHSKLYHAKKGVVLAMLLTGAFLLSFGIAHSQSNQSISDLNQLKTVIDFRTGNPDKALVYLTLIGDTFKDHDIQELTARPNFEVIFGGESVKLFAKEVKGYSPQEQKTITVLKNKISSLAKDGIKFEYCIYGGKLFGVEPGNVPGMQVVANGWVSLIGYQASGYSVVPAF